MEKRTCPPDKNRTTRSRKSHIPLGESMRTKRSSPQIRQKKKNVGLSVHATVELGVLTLGMQFPLGALVCNIRHSSSTSTAYTEANKQATCDSRIVKERNVFVKMITIRSKRLHHHVQSSHSSICHGSAVSIVVQARFVPQPTRCSTHSVLSGFQLSSRNDW